MGGVPYVPVTGRKPKPAGQARHRNPPVHEWTDVPDLPYDGPVPKLPTRRGGWPARTRRTWDAWSHMPHCRLWTPSDWAFALDTLEIAATFHDGELKAAAELRSREKVMGTTVDFRRDLRIRYIPQGDDETAAKTKKGGSVSKLDDYRSLYND